MSTVHDLVILTAYNSAMGSGHFWRSLTLLDHALSLDLDACLVTDNIPVQLGILPNHIQNKITTVLPETGPLLLRDMRDTTAVQIEELKYKFDHVVTVDDSGEGDQVSDLSIKLLPTPENIIDTNEKAFLFGYTFVQFVRNLPQQQLKEFDVAVYTGASDSPYPLKLQELLPAELSIIYFNSAGAKLWQNGECTSLSLNYTEILLRSRIFISHFGITLFEAALLECNIITINPTAYHSKLCNKESRIPITNLGTFETTSREELLSTLVHKSGSASRPGAPDQAALDQRITQGCEAFFAHLQKFL